VSDRSLVMLAFEFPPLDVVGVRRSASLVRYLPAHGIVPIVVTADRASLSAWTGRALDAIDPEAALPTPVHRVPCPLPAGAPHRSLARVWHYLSLAGDVGTAWAPQLDAAWDRIVAGTRPLALYVSMPPAPVDLSRRSRLPLILDFRDHWSQWGDNAFPSRWHYRRELSAERRCLERAAAVIGVTTQLVRDLQRAHPHIAAGKFHVVPNGWDEAEVAAASPAERDNRLFVIGHAGRFYYSPAKRRAVLDPWWRKAPRQWLQYAPRREDWLYRSPYFFFRALRRLLDRRPDLEARIRVRFAGDVEDWFAAQVAEFRLERVVEHLGRLPHDACLAFEAECDALLITAAKVEGGRDYCIAGKTFEYLAIGRPILGVVTDGEQRDFLSSSGGAVLADADDADGAATVIEHLVTGGAVPARNSAFIDSHHRREMTRRIAAIVESVAA
jgi:glycosyltransferase involved in cell wall biosynthesis